MLLPLGVIGVPVLLTMASLLFFYALGMPWTEFSAAAFCLIAFTSNFILLPLAAGWVARSRELKRQVADEMMAFFSTRIVELYSASNEPALAEDPRTAAAFEIYSEAEREIEQNSENLLRARETIERGVFLVDEVMSDYGRRASS